MRRRPIILAVASMVGLASQRLSAGEGREFTAPASDPAGTLLYLDRAGWQQAGRMRKLALATDFMRIYCGDPAMPPLELVACLDSSSAAGAMFEPALSCVAGAQAAGGVR